MCFLCTKLSARVNDCDYDSISSEVILSASNEYYLLNNPFIIEYSFVSSFPTTNWQILITMIFIQIGFPFLIISTEVFHTFEPIFITLKNNHSSPHEFHFCDDNPNSERSTFEMGAQKFSSSTLHLLQWTMRTHVYVSSVIY